MRELDPSSLEALASSYRLASCIYAAAELGLPHRAALARAMGQPVESHIRRAPDPCILKADCQSFPRSSTSCARCDAWLSAVESLRATSG